MKREESEQGMLEVRKACGLGGGGRGGAELGREERQMSGKGETERGRNASPKTMLVEWGAVPKRALRMW